jgi:hypothetical protein
MVREAQDMNRIMLGQPEFDAEIRGISAGHLLNVQGFSHSGKTQWLANKVIRTNKHRRILMMTPDEPAPLVLAKLAAIESGVPARELEQRAAVGDVDTIKLLRRVAAEDYRNLIVVHEPLTPTVMRQAFDEASDVWGAEPELVIVDFLDLLQHGDNVMGKFDFVKSFGIERKTRMCVIHQTSRGKGAGGQKMTIDSGSYGGETHATFMIGVRRKKSAIEARLNELEGRDTDAACAERADLTRDLMIHKYTITVNTVKNKRPGGGLVDDIDLEIDKDTGRLYDLSDGHGGYNLPSQYLRDLEESREARKAAEAATSPVRAWEEPELEYGGES